MAEKRRWTTHRSVAGKKLYAVRDASGRFKDIQTYERAHGHVVVLDAAYPRSFDIAKLTWCDHLVVHTADIDGPSSFTRIFHNARANCW